MFTWFRALAARLLCGARLWVGADAHRIREIEFYYQDEHHPDPFAHAHPYQTSCARWYLHRNGAGLRNGTYKGIDITFGPRHGRGGILLRSIEPEARPGEIVDGSALCVERMLALTGAPDVSTLDARIGPHLVDDRHCPIRIEALSLPDEDLELWATARVGLTLKRAHRHSKMPGYIVRPYRFLSAPRAIKKGRLQLLLAMLLCGLDIDDIRRLTGSPRPTIERAQSHLLQGIRERGTTTPEAYFGRSLDTADQCTLHGLLGSLPSDGPRPLVLDT